MFARWLIAAIVSLALAGAGASLTVAQDGEKKSPAKKAAPKKKTPAKKKAEPEKKAAPRGSPQLVAQFGDWGVYVNKTAKTCFALSQPKERAPGNVKRGPAYFFVTTQPAEKLANEVSIMTGLPLKDANAAALSIAGTSFAMFAKGDGIWIKDPADEAKLVDAMRKGQELVLTLTPPKGADTTDRYSLSGFTQAIERVSKECS
jgi:hypothetical protein